MHIVTFFLALFFTLVLPQYGDVRVRKPAPSCLSALRGSPAALVKQNTIADQYALSRIRDDVVLKNFIKEGILVALPQETEIFRLAVEARLRYTRPWTKEFLERFSVEFLHTFDRRLKITSLVRTERDQKRLVRAGISDARGESDDRRSPHLTGAAFDISKRLADNRQMSQIEAEWVCEKLRFWEQEGFVEAIHEPHNNHFHVMVFPNFPVR